MKTIYENFSLFSGEKAKEDEWLGWTTLLSKKTRWYWKQ